jgi:uncharacterized LabA/DUF88 family protein
MGSSSSLAPLGLRPGGIFFEVEVNRTTFLVDGFNLYHSLRTAQDELGGMSTKWLNLRSLLSSYLPIIGKEAVIEDIYYFSAFAGHMDARRPGVTDRHRLYLACLASTGVIPIMGRFKSKTVWCYNCKESTPHYEEKETDVAISVKLIELLHRDRADTVMLVTGDTDVGPAVRTAMDLFPTKQIGFAFPYRRINRELERLVSMHFYIRKTRYAAHQFADPCTLPNGRVVSKPAGW